MKKIITISLTLSISLIVYAGGNPEHVAYPAGYKAEFTHYDTRNRVNGKELAMLYANKIAVESAGSGKLAEGSIVIMEIYKPEQDATGNPIKDANGLFGQGKHAAVAVMEKRSNWDAGFDAKERAGDWGFAIYNPDGTPKDNNLDCATCHIPMPENDYMFSYKSLVDL